MGGPGGGRNPFGQMSEEEKKKARERRQEERKWYTSTLSQIDFNLLAGNH